MKVLTSSLLALTLLALPSPSAADDAPPLDCLHILGARLSPEGPADVHVHVARGHIVAVHHGVDPQQGAPRDGCPSLRAGGAVLTPGFIDSLSLLGLVELGSEKGTHDHDNRHPLQPGDAAIRAAVDTSAAYNPRSVAIPVARLEGVTTVIGAPTGGIIHGATFAADLIVGPRREAIVATHLAQTGTLGGRTESRAGTFFLLDRLVAEARLWPSVRAAFQSNARSDLMTPWPDLEAMQPVVDGKIPLVLSASRAVEIESALDRYADPRGPHAPGLKLIIAHGAEAWIVRDRLAALGVPVIIDPLLFGPGGFDQLQARPDAAALLEAAGVKVIIAQRDAHFARKLRQLAGNAVREGMSWQGALDAITRHPAEAFGLKDHGVIAPGAVANLVLWRGDPLDTMTSMQWLMIQGRPIALRSRQTELFERHASDPGR